MVAACFATLPATLRLTIGAALIPARVATGLPANFTPNFTAVGPTIGAAVCTTLRSAIGPTISTAVCATISTAVCATIGAAFCPTFCTTLLLAGFLASLARALALFTNALIAGIGPSLLASFLASFLPRLLAVGLATLLAALRPVAAAPTGFTPFARCAAIRLGRRRTRGADKGEDIGLLRCVHSSIGGQAGGGECQPQCAQPAIAEKV